MSLVDSSSLDHDDKPLQMKMPEGLKPEDSARLQQIWRTLQVLMEDEESRPQVRAMLRKLQARQQHVVPEVPGKAPAAAAPAVKVEVLPTIAAEDAVALQSQLFDRYSQPDFQNKLFNIYCSNDPRSLAYAEKLSALLRSVREDVLPGFGLPSGPAGDTAMALALGEWSANPDLQALTASIDELFYSAEAPLVENSTSLSKRSILALLREQIAAFRKPAFQEKLRCLKTAELSSQAAGADDEAPSKDGGRFVLEGRSELALEEQGPILRAYGLEPNSRGVHSLLHQFAQHIMDPEVATCGAAINRLLGVEEPARARFTQRLKRISAEDPGPRLAQKPEPRKRRLPATPPPPNRRHSAGAAGPDRRPSLLRELEDSGLLPPSRPRRRSISEVQARGVNNLQHSLIPEAGASAFLGRRRSLGQHSAGSAGEEIMLRRRSLAPRPDEPTGEQLATAHAMTRGRRRSI